MVGNQTPVAVPGRKDTCVAWAHVGMSPEVRTTNVSWHV